ncbi:MAG: hypothetical protein R2685_16225 [Candidatus Nitrosocosmicus sp.]|nr:hypothetical protein [Candidatus Nitrosocosmicus sp.]
MDFEFSPKLVVSLSVILAIAIFFIFMGESLQQILGSTVREYALVQSKQKDFCVVETSDNMSRYIHGCPYVQGDNILTSYTKEVIG